MSTGNDQIFEDIINEFGKIESDPNKNVDEEVKEDAQEEKPEDNLVRKSSESVEEAKQINEAEISAAFGPGKYYFGDVCYVMDDDVYHKEWGKEDDPNWHEVGYQDGVHETSKGTFVVAGTAYGDGVYRGTDGRDYGVDAGVLGIVPESLWKVGEAEAGGMGKVIDVRTKLEFEEQNGVFQVTADGDTFVVDTSNGDEDDEMEESKASEESVKENRAQKDEKPKELKPKNAGDDISKVAKKSKVNEEEEVLSSDAMKKVVMDFVGSAEDEDVEEIYNKYIERKASENKEVNEHNKATLEQLRDAWDLIGSQDDDPEIRAMADEKVDEINNQLDELAK